MKIAYLPQRQKRQNIILAILLLGLPLLVFAAYQAVKIVSRAGTGTEPQNVVISNITSSMVSISWTTESSSLAYVIPVENGSKKAQIRDSRSTNRMYTHYIEVEDLEPNTKYSFIIKSENKEYTTSDGKPLEFTTAPIVGSYPTPGSITGVLKGSNGEDVLLYAFLTNKSAYPVSPLGGAISKSGEWIMSMTDTRTIEDKSYATINGNSDITIIAVDGRGKTAKIQGLYSELFDSNGELKPTQNLTLGDNGDVYSLLPTESTPVIVEPIIDTDPDTDPDPYPDIDLDPDPDPDPDPIPDEEDFQRVYRIVQQISWTELTENDTGDNGIEDSFTGSKTIRVVDVTDSGFRIIWSSSSKENGYVNYGTSASSLDTKVLDERDSLIMGETESYYVHTVLLDRLQAETKYYFEVVSGDNTYDNNGSKYQQSTSALIDPPAYKTVGVAIENPPAHGEIAIIAHIEDKDDIGSSGKSSDISCIVANGGDQCTLVISNSRVSDGTAFYEYTDEDLLVIEPYTTYEIEKISEPLTGLEGSGVEIALKKVASSNSNTTTKVSALSTYGLTNSSSEIINTDSDINEIPKTGVLDSLWVILILAGILVISAILLYLLTRGRNNIKSKMVTGL